jgi:signal transduction histidine kinase
VAAGPAARLPAHGDAGCLLAPGLPCGSTDALQLQAALANLVANAVDATLDGGRILIGTALEHRLDPDADSTLQRGYVTLSVCDEGHGMAADIAERATEPFFTTKDIGKGSGLGLSQVFGFTTQSGGFVDVSTTPGVGTDGQPVANPADDRATRSAY